mgnify:CR=1 FL=1
MGLFHEFILLSDAILIDRVEFINLLFLFLGKHVSSVASRLPQEVLDLLIAELLLRRSLLLFRLSRRGGPHSRILMAIILL